MSNSIHFYRILTPDFPSKLILPLGLSRALPSENNEVTLTNSTTKKSWKVDLISVGDRHYFGGERWHEFTVANGLDYGFVLIFCFDGGVCFSFRAYNLRGLEINVASSERIQTDTKNAASLEKTDTDAKEEDASEEDEELDSLNGTADENDDEDDKGYGEEDHGDFRPHREEVAEYERRRRNENQKNAWFYTKMTAKHFDGSKTSYVLYVPRAFRDAIDLSSDIEDVRVIDPRGQSRIIGCLHQCRLRGGYKDRETLLTRGWSKLVRENGLKVGDNCKFESVPKNEDGLINIRMTVMNHDFSVE